MADHFEFKAKLHHHAYRVRTGMMIWATTLLEKMGFILYHEHVAEWGRLRDFGHLFFGHPAVQLIEDKSISPDKVGIDSDTPHLGIQVSGMTAVEAAAAMIRWAEEVGVGSDARMKAADRAGNKIFIYIPQLLAFTIELVWVPED